ncbi:M48 family metalloprotease [Desulfobacter sp.]|uniref:M48 family metalloprotease n=1 Tax=Desulfobacter sp. TaxID=2294 RepID=UPI003D0B8DC6
MAVYEGAPNAFATGPSKTNALVAVSTGLMQGMNRRQIDFSRQREYRADMGAADLMGGRQPMIDALRVLGSLGAGELPKEMAASGISGKDMMSLLSSHPAAGSPDCRSAISTLSAATSKVIGLVY